MILQIVFLVFYLIKINVMFYNAYISHCSKETQILAKILLQQIRSPMLFALYGDLGSGKTIFVKGLINCLYDKKHTVKSQSFLIANTYNTSPILHHIDFYRLNINHQLDALGIDDLLFDMNAFICIEWIDKYYFKFPDNIIFIEFVCNMSSIRKIHIYSIDKLII